MATPTWLGLSCKGSHSREVRLGKRQQGRNKSRSKLRSSAKCIGGRSPPGALPRSAKQSRAAGLNALGLNPACVRIAPAGFRSVAAPPRK